MQKVFYDMLEANPVIAAVKDMEGLEQCCQTEEIKVVFILFGDICNIEAIVERVKEADKTAMVHMDLVQGLSAKEIAVDFIRQHTKADGIISTKPSMIKRARELSLYTVMRFFLLDSMSFDSFLHGIGKSGTADGRAQAGCNRDPSGGDAKDYQTDLRHGKGSGDRGRTDYR